MKARVKNFDVEVEPMTKYEFYDRIKNSVTTSWK